MNKLHIQSQLRDFRGTDTGKNKEIYKNVSTFFDTKKIKDIVNVNSKISDNLINILSDNTHFENLFYTNLSKYGFINIDLLSKMTLTDLHDFHKRINNFLSFLREDYKRRDTYVDFIGMRSLHQAQNIPFKDFMQSVVEANLDLLDEISKGTNDMLNETYRTHRHIGKCDSAPRNFQKNISHGSGFYLRDKTSLYFCKCYALEMSVIDVYNQGYGCFSDLGYSLMFSLLRKEEGVNKVTTVDKIHGISHSLYSAHIKKDVNFLNLSNVVPWNKDGYQIHSTCYDALEKYKEHFLEK